MEAGDFVDKLDKLNKLKKDGVISDMEYEAQVNKIKKQYSNSSNIYIKNRGNNSTPDSINAVASLLLIATFIIGGIWIYSSGIVDSIIDAGKDFSEIFEEDSTSQNIYNYNTSSSSNSKTNSHSSSNLNSNPSTTTPTTIESKSSYIASCKNYNSKYEDMKRNPNSYKELRMKFRGMVESRWSRNGSTSAFTLSACTEDNMHIGMLYCTIDKSVLDGKNLLQYDYINVYGEFKGITNNLYNIYGYLDYPELEVKYIEFTTY